MLSLKYILRHRRCFDNDGIRVGDVWTTEKIIYRGKIFRWLFTRIKLTRFANSAIAKYDAFEDSWSDSVGLWLACGQRGRNDFTARRIADIADLFVLLLAVCTRNIERHCEAYWKISTPLFTQLFFGSWRLNSIKATIGLRRHREKGENLKSVTRWARKKR